MLVNSSNASLRIITLCVVATHFVASQMGSERNLQEFYNPQCNDFSLSDPGEHTVKYFNTRFEAEGLCDGNVDQCALESTLQQCFNDALSCRPAQTISFRDGYTQILEYTNVIISRIGIIEHAIDRRRYLRSEFSGNDGIVFTDEFRALESVPVPESTGGKCVVDLSIRVLVNEGDSSIDDRWPERGSTDPIHFLFPSTKNTEEDEEEEYEIGAGRRHRHLKKGRSRYTGDGEESKKKGKKPDSDDEEKPDSDTEAAIKKPKSTKASSSNASKKAPNKETENYPPVEEIPWNGEGVWIVPPNEPYIDTPYNGEDDRPVPQIYAHLCSSPLFVDSLTNNGFGVNEFEFVWSEFVSACKTPFACRHSFCCETLFPENCVNDGDACI